MVQITHLHAHKQGNKPEDYEDASSSSFYHQSSRKSLNIAIADGVSSSAFAGEWANYLVSSYSKSRFKEGIFLQNRIKLLGSEFTNSLDFSNFPWYLKEKMESGAFSTFTGLSINLKKNKKNKYRWNSIAIGDSCLFHIRKDKLKLGYPVLSSNDFSMFTSAISSNFTVNNKLELWGKFAREQGNWKYGDQFFLLTDAIGQWFMAEYEKGNKPWKQLFSVARSSERDSLFEEFIETLRREGSLHNDDVTCVIVEL